MNKPQSISLEEAIRAEPEAGPKPRKLSLEQYNKRKAEKEKIDKLTKIPEIKNFHKRAGHRNKLLKLRAHFKSLINNKNVSEEDKSSYNLKLKQINEQLKDEKKLKKINKW